MIRPANLLDTVLRSETVRETDTYLRRHVDAEGLRQLTRMPPGYEKCKSFEVIILLPPKEEEEEEKWPSLKDLPEYEDLNRLQGILSAYKGSVDDLRAERIKEYESIN